MNKNKLILVSFLAATFLFSSCKKYLDEKSDKKLVIPSEIQDLQGLLDLYSRVNQFNPAAGEKSADDYYLLTPDWQGLRTEEDKRIYTWQPDNLIKAGIGTDWSNAYDNVYKANTVLYEIERIHRQPGDELAFDVCKGHAYFIRANTFFAIAAIWAPAYDEITAATDLGIPLRLNPDFNLPTTRASVKETFDQIISDARQAAALLPVSNLHLLRPAKAAAYSLMARTFLAMHLYDSSLKYANLSLNLNNKLKDYNELNSSATYPFEPRFSNPEILFDSYMNSGSILAISRSKIDSTLYQSYAGDDLRKTVFFRNNNNGSVGFKGSYAGSALFDGLANNEVYLIKAESLAWLNKTDEAMGTLNQLLINRWKTNTFIPFTATNNTEALEIILAERRKELLMRNLRWMDIKRLNKNGQNISLTRYVDGQTYSLPPNDLRFALPIPEDVIELTGIKQNPR